MITIIQFRNIINTLQLAIDRNFCFNNNFINISITPFPQHLVSDLCDSINFVNYYSRSHYFIMISSTILMRNPFL